MGARGREGGIQPAAGSGGRGWGKWRTWWRAGLSCGGVTSAFTHWRGRTSTDKRQQSVVAAECALVRFVDGQRWWSWWLQDGCVQRQDRASGTMRSINRVGLSVECVLFLACLAKMFLAYKFFFFFLFKFL